MKTAVILHGMPSKEDYLDVNRDSQSNSHWLPWLQQQLIAGGVLAQTPELPDPYEPDYEKWRTAFERFPIDEDTTLVGHSCGGGFLVRWLSENDIKVGKVVLVAPWINVERDSRTEMFDSLVIDGNLTAKAERLILFNSDNDDEPMKLTLERLRSVVPNLQVRNFHNYGHFTLSGMRTREFPELAEEVLT